MGSMSIWHWLLLLAVVVLLFGGRGKVSELMGDVAKGMKAFKKGMAEDETPAAASVKTIDGKNGVPITSTEQSKVG
ncbi:twin-arginine translocase TatA/TatE family subunit [Labrys monachus]|uniref:Sec-independent protein translocase protein TatA n=1 Tax=Labrys monachus TaxID=217067 RepID=A0ABU0FEH1_9HYPH|nr:twin-arginine translocase TatA/TatE family subunit [Labrys monachus]MDQ0393008.1 sec-independent protein translocase protein TatA [Labrys monachus]